MRSLVELETAIPAQPVGPDVHASADALLKMSEEVLEHWVVARGQVPTDDTYENFRLLALHRQGAKGDPSFNACRETCREIAYHFNLATMQADHAQTTDRLEMMKLLSNHLLLFVSGKMQAAELGEFCCSSKPIRLSSQTDSTKEA